MNYENTSTGEIISEEDYIKLTPEDQFNYRATSFNVTHRLNENREEDGSYSLLETIVAAEVISDIFDNSSTPDNDFSSSDNSSSDCSGGGGDFGGGGAGGEY